MEFRKIRNLGFENLHEPHVLYLSFSSKGLSRLFGSSVLPVGWSHVPDYDDVFVTIVIVGEVLLLELIVDILLALCFCGSTTTYRMLTEVRGLISDRFNRCPSVYPTAPRPSMHPISLTPFTKALARAHPTTVEGKRAIDGGGSQRHYYYQYTGTMSAITSGNGDLVDIVVGNE